MTESIIMQLSPGMSPAPAGPRGVGMPLALRVGYDMRFDVGGPLPTAMVFMLYAHPAVAGQLEGPERIVVEPEGSAVETFLDSFGNRCARLIATPGVPLRVAYDNVFQTTYDAEAQPDSATPQEAAGALPVEVLPFLLGSRYCEVDRLSAIAWDLFGKLPAGGTRALAINRWVFENVRFGYRFTRPNKTALDTYVERSGVCRDMTHLAIAFCRAMNIPARYATGYLADIDAEPDPTPMDFSAFYEVYLGGRWWPMDARHGRARIGRVLMARGRDATDVALVTSFGPHKLTKFTVLTEPVGTMTLPMPVPAEALARSA
ncbi:MAG TPA: transglutaminase family protein [Tepidisphaeraceae bacterium]